jgi:Uma2 family endonuclease
MAPIGSRHAASVKRLNHLFATTIGPAVQIGFQDPIALGVHNEPQPDVVLVRPRADFYAAGHPTPDDILLVVEVADTSAESDRQSNVPLYARSAIAELWLVDLPQERISTYRDPSPSGYRAVQDFPRGAHLAPLAFPDRLLAVDDILG